jgi:hypothetical protein
MAVFAGRLYGGSLCNVLCGVNRATQLKKQFHDKISLTRQKKKVSFGHIGGITLPREGKIKRRKKVDEKSIRNYSFRSFLCGADIYTDGLPVGAGKETSRTC